MNKTSITSKIKNCPFCGARAIGYRLDTSLLDIMGIYSESLNVSSFIECEKCGVSMSASTEKDLLRKWNTRLKEQNKVKLMVPTLSGDYAAIEFSRGQNYQEVLDNAFKLAKKIGGMVVI